MTDHQRGIGRSSVAAGVCFWLVFAMGSVIVRGVQWDETYEQAQVITRHVAYPEGHPMFRYCRNAFSLQTYASAAMMELGAGPVFICGLRNVLMILSTILPVFLFVSWIGGGALWGHAAALLALRGIYLEFDGSYPLAAWPGLYSNGAIGGGYALIALYALARKRYRTAFFMIGLMPCIHIGQWPPLLVMPMLFVLPRLILKRQWRYAAQNALWFAVGLAGCLLVGLAIKSFAAPAPVGGPYAAVENAHSIWKGYTVFYDGHRQLPPGNGFVSLFGLAALGYAFALRDRRRGAVIWGYAATLNAMVLAIMAAHLLSFPDTPFLLIGWMPYRLVNHAAPLLLALIAGILAANGNKTKQAGRAILFMALAYAIAFPLLPHLAGESFFNRYLSGGEAIFFALYGAAAAGLVASMSIRARQIGTAIGLAILAGLACYHRFGAACLVAGGLAMLFLRWKPVFFSLGQPAAVAALCAILAAVLIVEQGLQRNHLPSSPFDRRLEKELDARGHRNAMLLTPPNEFLMQAKTGHPVLVDNATASLMSYMPSLAPAINQIYRDAYGITFDYPEQGQHRPSWRDVWKQRSLGEWAAFAGKYNVRYLVAPAGIEMALPAVFTEDNRSLFRFP